MRAARTACAAIGRTTSGARSVFDDAEGGAALLVFNGELRFPIYRWLKGVGFVDVGNVYPKVSDISFTDLQIGVGAGARFDTPFGLIRFDLGIPANRRSFDPRWRLHVDWGTRSDASIVSKLCGHRPRTVRMIDWTAGLSGAFGASLRKFSK